MHLAASSGKKEILMYLIKKGGTIHEKNKKVRVYCNSINIARNVKKDFNNNYYVN